MSMLQAQVDELRAMAESVGLAMPQAATLMMEAADTIWELRGSVHRERAEADRLRALAARAWRLFVEHGAVQPSDLPEVDAVRNGLRELGVEVEADDA